jgi:hypothetical protein
MDWKGSERKLPQGDIRYSHGSFLDSLRRREKPKSRWRLVNRRPSVYEAGLLTTGARTPDLRSSLFPSGSPIKILGFSKLFHAYYTFCLFQPPWFDCVNSIYLLEEYKILSCSPLSFCFLCVPKPQAHMGLRHQSSYEPDFCEATLAARQASKHNVNTVQVTVCFLSLSQVVDGRSMLINWLHFSKCQNFTYSQRERTVTNHTTYDSSAETDRHRLYLRACCITRKIVTWDSWGLVHMVWCQESTSPELGALLVISSH